MNSLCSQDQKPYRLSNIPQQLSGPTHFFIPNKMKFNFALAILATSAYLVAAWTLTATKDSSCVSPDGWSLSGEGPQDCFVLAAPPRSMNFAGLPRGLDFPTYSDANCENIQTSGGGEKGEGNRVER
jgi:hypothetical protein